MTQTPAPSPPSDTAPSTGASLDVIALIVACAMFMESLDGTIIVTALPQMGHTFGVAPTAMSLAITIYLTTLAMVIPLSGWAADRFGARRVFSTAVGLFTLASVLCGLAPNFGLLLAARALQAIAAAAMTPLGRLIVMRSAEKHQLIKAVVTITWPALIAPVIGPAIGGAITTWADWRWIFYVNLPIGVIGVFCVRRFLPDNAALVSKPFDGKGFALTAGFLGCLVLALDLVGGGRAAWGPAGILLAASALLGPMALRRLRTHQHPILDPRPVAVRTFRLSQVTAGALFRMSISATPFLLPMMMQIAYRRTPFEAGLFTLIYMAGNLSTKSFTTPLIRRFRFRDILVWANLASAGLILACAFVAPSLTNPWTWAMLFLAGVARSLGMTAINTLSFADIPGDLRGSASALQSVFQQLAFSIGVAVAAGSLELSKLLPGLPAPVANFRLAFAVIAALPLIAALLFLGLHRDDGENLKKAPA